jgi:hypothetical protein
MDSNLYPNSDVYGNFASYEHPYADRHLYSYLHTNQHGDVYPYIYAHLHANQYPYIHSHPSSSGSHRCGGV